jgi:hypothetical protein
MIIRGFVSTIVEQPQPLIPVLHPAAATTAAGVAVAVPGTCNRHEGQYFMFSPSPCLLSLPAFSFVYSFHFMTTNPMPTTCTHIAIPASGTQSKKRKRKESLMTLRSCEAKMKVRERTEKKESTQKRDADERTMDEQRTKWSEKTISGHMRT